MEDEIHGAFDVDVARDVVPHELEITVSQVSDVRQVARQQVVHTHDGVAAIEKRLAEMGSNESRCTGNDCSHSEDGKRGDQTR
jgi:hypothetical protein